MGAQKLQQALFSKSTSVRKHLVLRFNGVPSFMDSSLGDWGIYGKEMADYESDSGTYPGLFLSMDRKIS